jgi:TonB family protein
MNKPVPLLAVVFMLYTAIAQQTPTRSPSANETRAAQNSADFNDAILIGHPLRVVDPIIPAQLRDKTMGASLSATLTTKGTFEDLRFAGGADELSGPAIEAIKQWLYSPATKAGSEIELKVYIAINSDKGMISTSVEPDLPFPVEPQKSIPEQVSEGTVYYIQPGVVEAPHAIYAPDPEYSQAARAAKCQGLVVVGVIIGADGTISDIWVTKKAGLGLDQETIRAVRTWKFQPGIKASKPVPVLATIESQFHLY